jgi:hypothetical protein
MLFDGTPEFKKDLKRLSKKYRSLDDDLKELEKILELMPLGSGKHFNTLTIAGIIYIVKARLFCRYLKGSSLRIIYAFHKEAVQKVVYIQLYPKNESENEDTGRIQDYLSQLGKSPHS